MVGEGHGQVEHQHTEQAEEQLNDVVDFEECAAKHAHDMCPRKAILQTARSTNSLLPQLQIWVLFSIYQQINCVKCLNHSFYLRVRNYTAHDRWRQRWSYYTQHWA